MSLAGGLRREVVQWSHHLRVGSRLTPTTIRGNSSSSSSCGGAADCVTTSPVEEEEETRRKKKGDILCEIQAIGEKLKGIRRRKRNDSGDYDPLGCCLGEEKKKGGITSLLFAIGVPVPKSTKVASEIRELREIFARDFDSKKTLEIFRGDEGADLSSNAAVILARMKIQMVREQPRVIEGAGNHKKEVEEGVIGACSGNQMFGLLGDIDKALRRVVEEELAPFKVRLNGFEFVNRAGAQKLADLAKLRREKLCNKAKNTVKDEQWAIMKEARDILEQSGAPRTKKTKKKQKKSSKKKKYDFAVNVCVDVERCRELQLVHERVNGVWEREMWPDGLVPEGISLSKPGVGILNIALAQGDLRKRQLERVWWGKKRRNKATTTTAAETGQVDLSTCNFAVSSSEYVESNDDGDGNEEEVHSWDLKQKGLSSRGYKREFMAEEVCLLYYSIPNRRWVNLSCFSLGLTKNTTASSTIRPLLQNDEQEALLYE
eukprot:Nk52_evm44s2391 gene=Nk52_evmTU44s2391